MEKQRRKTKLEKIVALFCIFVILQGYFSYFAQIAIAVNEALLGGEQEQSLNNEIQTSNEEQNVNEEQEQLLPSEETNSEEQAIEPSENEEQKVEENEEELIGEEGGNPFNGIIPEKSINENISEEQLSEENNTEANTEENSNEKQEENNDEEIEEQNLEPYIEPEVEVEVTSENSSIYKGYLYANATSELRYTTDYNTIDTLKIVGGKNMTKLTVEDEPDKMQLITDTKIGLLNQMYYRRTRISVEEFNKILGKEGKITIYSPEEEIIGYINSETEIENEEYVYTYQAQYNSVKFELENIKEDGNISIKNDKAIKESTDFNRNQISLFSAINTIAQANLYVGEEVRAKSGEGNIKLEETESRMEMDLDRETLSIEETNPLAIIVTLKTDAEKYDLFENPTIDIEFPSIVEEIDVTSMNLLYRNGLSIENWEVVTNAIGNKVLKISLSGAQLEYTPGAVQEGTTLVVYTDIETTKMMSDTSAAIKMTYTNKDTIRKAYSLEGKDSEDEIVNFVGRQGILRAATVKLENGETITSYDNNIESIKIDAEEQNITIKGEIVNNYENKIGNVSIIGRIPNIGNKDEKGNDLGSNFNTELVNGITTSGAVVDVYYSEEIDAQEDDESWSQDTSEISKYKSYKIVARENEMAKGEKIEFEYTVKMPIKVVYAGKSYGIYTVNYKLEEQIIKEDCKIGLYTEEKEIELDDLKENEIQKVEDEGNEEIQLTIGTQVCQPDKVLEEGDTVKERQILRYNVVVSNSSDKEIKNITLKCNAENSNMYYLETHYDEDWFDNYGEEDTDSYEDEELNDEDIDEELDDEDYDEFNDEELDDENTDEELDDEDDSLKGLLIGNYQEDTKKEHLFEEFKIDSLKPGESKSFTYQAIVLKDAEEVYGKIVISSDKINEFEVKTNKYKVDKAEVEVRIGSVAIESMKGETEALSDSIKDLYIVFKNITNHEIESVIVKIYLSQGLEINEYSLIGKDEDISYEIMKEEKNSVLIFKLNKLNINEEREIDISPKLEKFDVTREKNNVFAYAVVETDSSSYISNDYKIEVYQNNTAIDYTWEADFDGEVVKHGDKINYVLTIKNKGLTDACPLNARNIIPKGLRILSINCFDNSASIKKNDSEINFDYDLKGYTDISLLIETQVDQYLLSKNQNYIENKFNITGYNIEPIDTNIISYKVERVNLDTDEGLEKKNEIYTNKSEEFENNNSSNENNSSENMNNNDSNINYENNNITNEVANVKKYSIFGKVWLDKNKNGINDNEEKGIEKIEVLLFKANTDGGIDTSNIILNTNTDENGNYKFEEVEEGTYVVAFKYDNEIYNITKYQVKEAMSNENSDAISKRVIINNEQMIIGLTDVLKISNTGYESIDMGLIEKNEFDLSLEKKIDEIKVTNENGSKTYKFEKGLNEKIEIKSKYYKSSVLDITYKIIVKNEGEVNGYVNKIIDYLPEGMAIDLRKNEGWYINEDGNLYYNGLVGKEIKAGESEEITLIVRKELTEGAALKLLNSAEIVEYTNSLGNEDKDSIENNKNEKEDDYGQAILLVSVSTGKIVQYVIILLSMIIIVSLIIRIIIKKLKTKKIYK